MRERLTREQSAAVCAERRRVLRAEHRTTVRPCAGSGRAPFTDYDDRGECEVCGDVFVLRKDGAVRAHDERIHREPDWRAKGNARQAARWLRAAMTLSGAAHETDYYA